MSSQPQKHRTKRKATKAHHRLERRGTQCRSRRRRRVLQHRFERIPRARGTHSSHGTESIPPRKSSEPRFKLDHSGLTEHATLKSAASYSLELNHLLNRSPSKPPVLERLFLEKLPTTLELRYFLTDRLEVKRHLYQETLHRPPRASRDTARARPPADVECSRDLADELAHSCARAP